MARKFQKFLKRSGSILKNQLSSIDEIRILPKQRMINIRFRRRR